MPSMRESSESWASADLGKDRVLVLGVDGFLSLWKTFWKTDGRNIFSAIHWATVWHRPKGFLEEECILCCRGAANVTAFTDGTALPPGLASPVSLHCWSAQLREAKVLGTLKPLLRSLLDIWDPRLGLGEHRVHPWPQVLSSLLYLHYWSPTKIEASFHQHQANQDNTYLNFIYSLNRQDRQRVAVETKALERWCDMTRSHSRRLREPGIDRGFLTPSPNDLSIGAR